MFCKFTESAAKWSHLFLFGLLVETSKQQQNQTHTHTREKKKYKNQQCYRIIQKKENSALPVKIFQLGIGSIPYPFA